jgi:very-short-patch-repair endonuclease
MEKYIIGITIIAVVIFILSKAKSQQETDYSTAYQPKWLFSYNEKDAYKKLKEITDKNGLYIFAKVRLYDLIEPKKGINKYKTAQNKIQAKHVDFVICNEKLVAKIIIELDDQSHNTTARQSRDKFVDDVLNATGHHVIRLKAVDSEKLESLILEKMRPEKQKI